MNKISKLLLGFGAVALTTACSDKLGQDENVVPGTETDNGAVIYLGVNFQMPGMGQGRSFTNGANSSDNGVEVGSDVENNVNEVLLVLADGTSTTSSYPFIAAAIVQSNDIYKHSSAPNSGAYHANAKFTKSDIASFYNNGTVKGEVAVFVFVNPSGNIVTAIENAKPGDTDWAETKGRVTVSGLQTEGAIWSTTNGGSFLMSNAYIAKRKLPKKLSDWTFYATGNHVFHLSEVNAAVSDSEAVDNSSTTSNGEGGPVKVERTAARFDFKDGSELGNNTYHVVYEQDENGRDDLEKPIIDILLNKMCLVNMNNEFYYLRRVSNNGLNTPDDAAANKWAICGAELPWYTDAVGTPVEGSGNFVVDAYAKEKQAGIKTGFSTYFNYTFFKDDGASSDENIVAGNSNWYVSQITDVLDGTADNWQNGDQPTGQYRVWRYVTENVIAPTNGANGMDFDNQTNGVSTGVVFKGKMQAINESLIPDSELEAMDPNSIDYLNAVAHNDLITIVNNKAGKTVASTDDPILYSFGGSLYATWEHMRQAAINASFSYTFNPDGTQIIADWNRENSLYKAVFGKGHTGYKLTVQVPNSDNSGTVDLVYEDVTDATDGGLDPKAPNTLFNVWAADGKSDATKLLPFKQAATGNDITIYQSSVDNVNGWGYYCYYYYWNRHNDNGNNGIPGPMEFAVVRNNVYKLAVTKISRLGHPRTFANDPDSPTPDTPDEKEDVYLTVDSEVLPWVVRVNNIEF